MNFIDDIIKIEIIADADKKTERFFKGCKEHLKKASQTDRHLNHRAEHSHDLIRQVPFCLFISSCRAPHVPFISLPVFPVVIAAIEKPAVTSDAKVPDMFFGARLFPLQ